MNKADAMAWQGRRLDIRNSNPSLPVGIFGNKRADGGNASTAHRCLRLYPDGRLQRCEGYQEKRAFHLWRGLFSDCGGYAHEMCLCDGWNPRGS